MSLTKSDSGSRPRLKRTLKRNVAVRDFVEDDIKFLYVAYKKGTLAAQEGLSAKEFHDWIIEWMLDQYDYAWTIECNGKPMGVVNAINCGVYALLGDTHWLPWASPRNRMEGFAKLIAVLRERMFLMGYANQRDKDFFVYMAKLGLIRRVGTIHELSDEPLALFQSRGHGRNH